MIEAMDIHTVWILLVGIAVILSGLIESIFRRLKLPPLVGYLLLGVDAAMVFVSIAGCIGAPIVLYRLLQRWPQKSEEPL